MPSTMIEWFYKRPLAANKKDLKFDPQQLEHKPTNNLRKSFTLPVLDQDMNTGYWFVVT